MEIYTQGPSGGSENSFHVCYTVVFVPDGWWLVDPHQDKVLPRGGGVVHLADGRLDLELVYTTRARSGANPTWPANPHTLILE